MINLLENFAAGLFSWAIIAIILSWLLSLGYPFCSHFIKQCRAKHGAFFTLCYALLGPFVATLSVIFFTLPDLAFSIISLHCHDDNCAPHSLHVATETFAGSATFFSALILVFILSLFILAQLIRSRQWLNRLNQLAESGSTNYHIVPSKESTAWCAGLLKPKVYCTSALIESLTKKQLQAVITHELTHAVRRDNLRKWLAHWATFVWSPTPKKRLRQDLSNFHEIICDLAASQLTNISEVSRAINVCGSHETKPDTVTNTQRINAVQREQNLVKSQAKSEWLRFALSLVLITGIFLTATTITIRFGHPFLEALSQ